MMELSEEKEFTALDAYRMGVRIGRLIGLEESIEANLKMLREMRE